MKLFFTALVCIHFVLSCAAQNIASHIETMKTSYASSGTIDILDNRTIVIEPKMPSPLCAMPVNKDGKITWSYYVFPLASIVVPLAAVDETLMSEDLVFTNPDAAKGYKPGDLRRYHHGRYRQCAGQAVPHHNLRSRKAREPWPRPALEFRIRTTFRRH